VDCSSEKGGERALTELEDVIKAVLFVLNSFPELPNLIKADGVGFQDLLPDKISLGFATLSNTIKVRSFIDGSYIGGYPFELAYGYFPQTNEKRIDGIAFLGKIADFLAQTEYPPLEDGRKLLNIKQTAGILTTFRSQQYHEHVSAKFLA
jgi:hypothetical protein